VCVTRSFALGARGGIGTESEARSVVGRSSPFIEAWRERDLGAARARLGEPRASTAFDEGRAMAWEQAVELAVGQKSAT